MRAIRFATLGHVTNDRLETGVFPGGAALYAALAAAQLQAQVRVLTSFGPDFVGAELLSSAGIQVDAVSSDRTTSFEATSLQGHRRWRVLAQARPLTQPVTDVDVLFACPVLDEVQLSAMAAPSGALLGAGLQGWFRSVRADGLVEPFRPGDLSFLEGCKVVFCSDEDLGDDRARLIEILRRLAEIAILTEGARGALLYQGDSVHRVHPCPAREVDPTGAGDTFAACFLLGLACGQTPLDAAAVATCAASLAIESVGPTGLGTLSARLAERLAWYRQNVPSPTAQ